MAALSLTNIHAYYGKAHILQGIDLSLAKGEVVGIFGRNGVGKTTLLRSTLNVVPRITGKIELHDRDISNVPTDERVRAGLGFMPQGLRVFPELSVEEHYYISAYTVRNPRSLDDILTMLPEVHDLRQRKAGTLSGGQQQLVSLMRSLATNCSVLLMDEPTEGLMPRMVERIADAVRRLAAQGLAVLLVEQNLLLGEAVCDRVYIMEKGKVEAEGMFSDLRAAGAFERYLGVV